MKLNIEVNTNRNSELYHKVVNDIFVGLSKLKRKIRKKYRVKIDYEID